MYDAIEVLQRAKRALHNLNDFLDFVDPLPGSLDVFRDALASVGKRVRSIQVPNGVDVQLLAQRLTAMGEEMAVPSWPIERRFAEHEALSQEVALLLEECKRRMGNADR